MVKKMSDDKEPRGEIKDLKDNKNNLIQEII